MGTFLPIENLEISKVDPEFRYTEQAELQNENNIRKDESLSTSRSNQGTNISSPKIKHYRTWLKVALFIIPLVLVISLIILLFSNIKAYKSVIQRNTTNLEINSVHAHSTYVMPNCVKDRKPSDNVKTNFTRFMPGWSATAKDFCQGSEYELLVADDQILSTLLSQEIACPEKISALEISTLITAKDIVRLLRIFCRVRELTFIGAEVCESVESLGAWHEVVKAESLIFIKFEQLNDCSTLFETLVHSVWAPNLQSLEFKCVGFTNRDFDLLSNFAQSTTFKTISCSDSKLCENLQFNVNRDINVLTGRISC